MDIILTEKAKTFFKQLPLVSKSIRVRAYDTFE